MQFHERLFALRKESGMTQTDLAEKLNVSRQAVSRWEMGTAKPDIDNLLALSKLYGVTVDHLLKGDVGAIPLPEQAAENAEQKKPNNAWLGLMLVLYMVLFAIIAVVNWDPVGAMVTAGILVVIVWGIKLIVCAIIRACRT